jgi:hypothetical protein
VFPYAAGPESPPPSNGIGIRGTSGRCSPVVMIRVGASPSRSIVFLATVTSSLLEIPVSSVSQIMKRADGRPLAMIYER